MDRIQIDTLMWFQGQEIIARRARMTSKRSSQLGLIMDIDIYLCIYEINKQSWQLSVVFPRNCCQTVSDTAVGTM